MKKTYIKPKSTVVAINVKENLMTPSRLEQGEGGNGDEGEAREVVRQDIRSRGAWEEW